VLYGKRFSGFNRHPKLEGKHAILSPSNYHWLNDDEEKLRKRLKNARAAARGDSLHALAAHAISEGVRLYPDGSTLSLYVNDAVELGMEAEKTLFYSLNAFGHADAIGFELYPVPDGNVLGCLRIHDLKTGVTPASMKQLYVYAAYFCLEYGFKPYEIEGELRLYQNDAIVGEVIDRVFLTQVISTTVAHQRVIDEEEMEGEAWA
jgi:hypothetical protein